MGLSLLVLAVGLFLAMLWRRLQSRQPRALLPFLVSCTFPLFDAPIEAVVSLSELAAAALFGACVLALYLALNGVGGSPANRLAMTGLALAPCVAVLIANLGPDVFSSNGPFATPGDEAAFWRNAGTALLFGLLALALIHAARTGEGNQPELRPRYGGG